MGRKNPFICRCVFFIRLMVIIHLKPESVKQAEGPSHEKTDKN